ncbi:farnesyl pyrophosphate synthase 2-like [Spodoptera litura]|uniref:Farnesyl pyrophosphate synthase 2-like n=1 Tax=Spodoptera litura TaxID=69820 RepID=A0A9J7DMW3_SPOLT|nr:farnesyl pyrophosphate synthase 2-like [Spodoptera litura]
MANLFLRRTLSCNQFRTLHKTTVNYNVPVPITFNSYKNQQKFREVQSEVLNTLMSSPRFENQLIDVEQWVTKLLDYTLEGGKRGRGLAVPFAYEMMEDPKNFTTENLHRARVLGWAVEILQAYLLTVDDIVDASETRRGKECWYLHSDVGLGAVNDCGILLACAVEVMDLYFGKEAMFADLIKITNGTLLQTSVGQYLDCSSGYTKEKNNLDKFTMELFDSIAYQKTGIYSFKFPMLLALTLVKDGKSRYSEEANEIAWGLGKLLQFQNDYKDVFVDDMNTGKVGTDIQEGKLTWFAVTALQRCTEGQRAIFKENYGSKNPEHVKRIKQLFDELELEKVYKEYESSVYEDLVRRIRALPTKGETQFYSEILEACCKHLY